MDINPKLKNYIYYNAWKYVLIIVLALFFLSLFFTLRANHQRQSQTLTICVTDNPFFDEEIFMFHLQNALHHTLPTTLQVEILKLTSASLEDPVFQLQLDTMLRTDQADIVILSKEHFQHYARQGAFLDLAPNKSNLSSVTTHECWATFEEDGGTQNYLAGYTCPNHHLLTMSGIDIKHSVVALPYHTKHKALSLSILNTLFSNP